MSEPSEIRPASGADLEGLVPLVRAYWNFEGIEGFDEAKIRRTLTWLMDHPGFGRAWIVVHAGEATGYLLASFVFSLEHGGLTAEIDEFYLEPGQREKGLGRHLLETAELAFAAHGCTNVSLQVGRRNHAARDFYVRCGYGARSGYDLLDKTLVVSKKPAGN